MRSKLSLLIIAAICACGSEAPLDDGALLADAASDATSIVDGAPSLDSSIPPDAIRPDAQGPSGIFEISWSVNVAGEPSTCGAVGAETVEVVAQGSSGALSYGFFPCDSYSGTFQSIVLDDYTLHFSLMDDIGDLIGTSSQVSGTLTIDGEVNTIPTVSIDGGPFS